MKVNFPCLALAVVLSGGAYAQSVMEHAAGAAGATVGTAGGKVLSNVLDQTLSKAADPTAPNDPASKARRPDKASPNGALTASPAEIAPPKPAGSTEVPQAPARKARAAAPAPVRPAFPVPAAPAFAPAPAPPTIEDFAKVKEGGARQDVFAALGTPSSHITIPDEGHLIEIMSYSDGRRRIGTVRLDNGQVVSVTTTAP
jgi:hypothetical protein